MVELSDKYMNMTGVVTTRGKYKSKGLTVKKAVRFSPDTLKLIEKKSTKSGKLFSEVVRQAVKKDLGKPKKAKDK